MGRLKRNYGQCAFKTLNKTFPKVPTVTVDGKSVPVTEVETRLLNITLPEGNIFDVPPGTGQPAGTKGLSVGRGWVTLLQPLTPGIHTIVIDINPKDPDTITTKIEVTSGL